MEKLILDYLSKNWSADNADKIIFAPVPKGNSGDLALNVFQLTKLLQKSPPEILSEIQEILENCNLLEKTEITGPYLNLFFASKEFFKQVFDTKLTSDVLLNKNIVLEFSGPNTNKPLHLGHMRNHALGISVSNILEIAGANMHRVNIINDRGIHICKSMLAYKYFGNNETPESMNKKSDHFIGDYYIKFETESKKNPALIEEVQVMLKDWENNDPKVRKLWAKMNNWTLSGHQETYKRQGIKFEKNYFESEYYEQGKDIAEKGLTDGVFTKRNDGTIIIQFEDENLGEKVILRADGTSIYLTQDLAVAVARNEDFHPDEMIYVVADEQNYHFKVLFECLDQLKVLDAKKLFHLGYGLVHLPDGRMKSREGNVVDADNLMDKLHKIASEKIKESIYSSSPPELGELCESHKRVSPGGQGESEGVDKNIWTEQEIYTMAEQIQNAAWKFYLLRTGPKKSITFDSKKSIDFTGATGPYLQYAGVRIQSILNKSNIGNTQSTNINSLGDEEKPLGIKILEWQKVLERAATEKNPTYIATYLTELAQTWSSFYAENSVLKAKTKELVEGRIALAKKVFDILEIGLECLGIEIPDRM